MKESLIYRKTLSLVLVVIMLLNPAVSGFAQYLPAISLADANYEQILAEAKALTDVAIAEDTDVATEPAATESVAESESVPDDLVELEVHDQALAEIRIDLLTSSDFHGHTARAAANDNDPGAPQFVAFAEWVRAQNPDPQNVFFVGGGDEFHGYALANFHQGRNVVSVFDYLTRDQDFNMHVALGNHEFSHGIGRAYTLGEEVTLLAADLFYQTQANMPAGYTPSTDYGQRPAFVKPYDVIEFPNHDITIGVIGLMNTGMRNLVSGGLAQFDLRSIHEGALPEHKDAIHDLIDHLRNDYGVGAVVAATHLGGTSSAIEYLAMNFDFDAILGGHVHETIVREHAGTPIIEAGQHGRNLGRFSFHFNEETGELLEITTWMSPINAIRDFAPRAAGEFGVLGQHAGHADWLEFANHYEAVTEILAPYIDEAEGYFGEDLGPVGIYFDDRPSRDTWVTRLNLDYVVERLDDPSVIAVSNSGGWRNTGMWPRTPQSPVYRREIYTTMPFDNIILVHQMYGRDLIDLLNNMGNNPRTGVHGTTDAWYITATGERITPHGHGETGGKIYRVSSSNHTWTQDSNTWRFPGNAAGNRFGMHVIAEPQVLLVATDDDANPYESWSSFVERASTDTSLWSMHGAITLRDSLEISTIRRGELGLEAVAAELTVAKTGAGSVAITEPFAPGDQTRNVNINNTRITVTATPKRGVEFLGWFANEVLVSTDLVYDFTITQNTQLTARFEGEPDDSVATVLTVEEARAITTGEVTVQGVVTTNYAPGAAGNAFFLQSPTGTNPESGILVRVTNATASQLAAFVGYEVEVTGMRNGNVSGNGFVGLENVTVANIADINPLAAAQLPEAVATTWAQLRDRQFQSMLVSLAVPVEISSATTGAANDPNRVLNVPGDGNFVIWQDPVASGTFNVGDQILINSGIVHWWNARNEVQLRIINPETDLELDAEASEPEVPEVDLMVTLTAIADFHGMMNSENSASDPGFARFVSFMNAYRDRIEAQTGYQPVVLHAGDAVFGQSINNLMWGEPALRMLNHLGVRYGAVGNHEFSWQNRTLTESFGESDPERRAELLATVNRNPNPIWEVLPDEHPLNVVAGGTLFLAADVVYADGHERAGEHPDWLEPYAILDDWYDEYGVKVAIIGLTHPNMESLVGPIDRADLNLKTPRLVDGEDTNFEWLEAMIAMLRDPDGPYGVNAVVALTHTSSGHYSNLIVDRLQQRGNAHFDGFFSGHSHDTANVIRTHGDLSTAVVLGAHHARGIGDIQLGFDANGELVHLQGNLATNVRAYKPDPEVFAWVHGVGATWEQSGVGNAIDLEISNQPSLTGDRANWGWEQVRDYWWGLPIGPRVTYATGSQHHRNQYLVNLLYDYVMREHAQDLASTTGEPFAGTVIINNQSAWRGQDASELSWHPDEAVNTAQLMAALTFENTMPLFEIRGRDLIEMLNMPGANRGAGETNTPTTPGRITDPNSPFYGQPNWFTMHGSTVTGAFYQEGVWYLASTLEPISSEGVYRLGASNHLFGGYEQNGGQHWPLPGNNHGNALGFDVIDFIDGNTQFGAAYDRGPRYAIRDTTNEMHITIQETWVREVMHRAQRAQAGESMAAWVEVEATEGGVANLEVWGLGTRDFPGASNHSGWGLPAYGKASNTTRDLVLNGSVVRATATITDATEHVFLGWFADEELLSSDAVLIFNADEDLTLTARFAELPKDPMSLAIAVMQNFLDNNTPDNQVMLTANATSQVRIITEMHEMLNNIAGLEAANVIIARQNNTRFFNGRIENLTIRLHLDEIHVFTDQTVYFKLAPPRHKPLIFKFSILMICTAILAIGVIRPIKQ